MSKKYLKNYLFLAILSVFYGPESIAAVLSRAGTPPQAQATTGELSRSERYSQTRSWLDQLYRREAAARAMQQTSQAARAASEAARLAREGVRQDRLASEVAAEMRAAREAAVSARAVREAERIRQQAEQEALRQNLEAQAQAELQRRGAQTHRMTQSQARAMELGISEGLYRALREQAKKDLGASLRKEALKRAARLRAIEAGGLGEELHKQAYEGTIGGVVTPGISGKLLKGIAGRVSKANIENAKEALIRSRIESLLRAQRELGAVVAPQQF